MSEKPERMLIQQRVAPTLGSKKSRTEIAVSEQHGERAGQHVVTKNRPYEQRHPVHGHPGVEDCGYEIDGPQNRGHTGQVKRQDDEIYRWPRMRLQSFRCRARRRDTSFQYLCDWWSRRSGATLSVGCGDFLRRWSLCTLLTYCAPAIVSTVAPVFLLQPTLLSRHKKNAPVPPDFLRHGVTGILCPSRKIFLRKLRYSLRLCRGLLVVRLD